MPIDLKLTQDDFDAALRKASPRVELVDQEIAVSTGKNSDLYFEQWLPKRLNAPDKRGRFVNEIWNGDS